MTDASKQKRRPIRSAIVWTAAVIAVALVGFGAVLIAPFILPGQTGSSGQGFVTDGYPTSMTATGDDGRTRTITVTDGVGNTPGLDAIVAGDRLVVMGSGFDASRGIYVGICKVPDRLDEKPGPCLGGVPALDDQAGAEGSVQWAPSNWINQEWAWRLFGARSYDSSSEGTFTAYLLVPSPVGEGVNCLDDQCGVYTRNDHTAVDNRLQDLYVPVDFFQ